MELKDVEMLPGVIVDINDPKRIGRVKAVVPTLFDDASMKIEDMPWIFPLTMYGNQTFSKMEIGNKIWCINNKANKFEYWYIPLFELNMNTKALADREIETDVIFSRVSNAGDANMYYSPETGVKLNFGESGISMTPEKDVEMHTTNGGVKITGNQVYMGSNDEPSAPSESGTWHNAVNGNALQSILNNTAKALSEAAAGLSGANESPYTHHLSSSLNNAAKALGNLGNLLTSNTFVN